jgi:hypothetical protein
MPSTDTSSSSPVSPETLMAEEGTPSPSTEDLGTRREVVVADLLSLYEAGTPFFTKTNLGSLADQLDQYRAGEELPYQSITTTGVDGIERRKPLSALGTTFYDLDQPDIEYVMYSFSTSPSPPPTVG